MKKLLSVVCIMIAAAAVCGCKFSDPVNLYEEITTDYSYSVADTSDFNNYGDFIYVSNDDRYVYSLDFNNYLVFTFNGMAVYEIKIVAEYENENAASEYVTGNVVRLMESGNYQNVKCQGKYVVCTLSIDNETYGQYYKGTRTNVENDFASFEKN